MNRHVTAAIVGFIAACGPAYYAVRHKPAPMIVQPQTTVISRGPSAAAPAVLPIKQGQRWLDTSVSPAALKCFDGAIWKPVDPSDLKPCGVDLRDAPIFLPGLASPSPPDSGTVSPRITAEITLTKSEQRLSAAQWGDLDQKEVDLITAAIKGLPKTPLTIFCEDDAKCGDMQLAFDNAFETDHWDTKLEKPLIDDTIGVATNREDLRDAINGATGGRLAVKIIAKNAPFDVLVIGKKGGSKPGTPPISARDAAEAINKIGVDLGHVRDGVNKLKE